MSETNLIQEMAILKLVGDFSSINSKYSATKSLAIIFEELQGWSNQENVNLDEVFASAKNKISESLKNDRGEFFGRSTIEKIDKLCELMKQYIDLHYQGKWRKMLRDQFKILNAYCFYIQNQPKEAEKKEENNKKDDGKK